MLTELVELPGGSFRMGSTSFYPEEAPIHTADVAGFAVERHPVTNAQFAEFVSATGYVTVAEQQLDPKLYPGVAAADLVPGAMVFRPSAGPIDLRDWRQWWDWAPGASWRHPFGPDSDIADKHDHPVVQVSYPDAWAYASWAGPAPADRGRVGVRRAGRLDIRVPLGRRADAGWPADGQHLAGQIPVPQRRRGRLARHLAGGHVRARTRSGSST